MIVGGWLKIFFFLLSAKAVAFWLLSEAVSYSLTTLKKWGKSLFA